MANTPHNNTDDQRHHLVLAIAGAIDDELLDGLVQLPVDALVDDLRPADLEELL